MNKLISWLSAALSIFLIYAVTAWKSVTALTLLKALTVVGFGLLVVAWPFIILMLCINFDKTLEAMHKSVEWSQQLLSFISVGINVTTVYVFAVIGSPLFTTLAIIGMLAGLASWAARLALAREYTKLLADKKLIEATTGELVTALGEGKITPDELFAKLQTHFNPTGMTNLLKHRCARLC